MNGFNGRTGLSSEDLTRYRSYVPGVDDVVWQPLYDYQTYPAAGQLLFTFFSVQRGSGVTSAFGGGAGAKTNLDTNMQLSGQLGSGNQFLAMGLEVEYWTSNTMGFRGDGAVASNIARNWNDVYSVLRNGVLNFSVQNRTYIEDAPLMKFPSQTGLAGVASNADATTAAAAGFSQIEYARPDGMAYNIVPVLLVQNQAFSVTVAYAALVPTVSTTTGRIGVRLNGKLIRNAQ